MLFGITYLVICANYFMLFVAELCSAVNICIYVILIGLFWLVLGLCYPSVKFQLNG